MSVAVCGTSVSGIAKSGIAAITGIAKSVAPGIWIATIGTIGAVPGLWICFSFRLSAYAGNEYGGNLQVTNTIK